MPELSIRLSIIATNNPFSPFTQQAWKTSSGCLWTLNWFGRLAFSGSVEISCWWRTLANFPSLALRDARLMAQFQTHFDPWLIAFSSIELFVAGASKPLSDWIDEPTILRLLALLTRNQMKDAYLLLFLKVLQISNPWPWTITLWLVMFGLWAA